MKTEAGYERTNRTGIRFHREVLTTMLEGTEEFGPTSQGSAQTIAEVRIRYAKEAEPTGSMPRSEKVSAEQLPLLDKLGARLAFERTGTRLYEALISKHDAYGTFAGGPNRHDLQHIHDEEHAHFKMVQEIIGQLGGDPTVVTPQANLQLTASKGILDVLVDPRTNLLECLETIVIAELADHESWRSLAAQVRESGPKDLLEKIEKAGRTEQDHLDKIRSWILAGNRTRTERW